MPGEFRHIDRVAFLLATSLLWAVPSLAADHLTADQVRAAFEKWIHPDAFVQVVRGPAPK